MSHLQISRRITMPHFWRCYLYLSLSIYIVYATPVLQCLVPWRLVCTDRAWKCWRIRWRSNCRQKYSQKPYPLLAETGTCWLALRNEKFKPSSNFCLLNMSFTRCKHSTWGHNLTIFEYIWLLWLLSFFSACHCVLLYISRSLDGHWCSWSRCESGSHLRSVRSDQMTKFQWPLMATTTLPKDSMIFHVFPRPLRPRQVW